MISDKNAPRLLGAAFLIVIVTSLLMGVLLQLSGIMSGSMSEILVKISNNLALVRISILFALITSAGIIVLAVLLYAVLHKQNKIIALVALGWWLAEAITLAMSTIGTSALIPLSLDFVKAGSPALSYYQTAGDFLYYGFDRQGFRLHMLFYCLGGILWYYLFYKSKYVPRFISLYGLIAASVALLGIVYELFGHGVSILVYLPLLPFELTIGAWLLIKGIRDGQI